MRLFYLNLLLIWKFSVTFVMVIKWERIKTAGHKTAAAQCQVLWNLIILCVQKEIESGEIAKGKRVRKTFSK